MIAILPTKVLLLLFVYFLLVFFIHHKLRKRDKGTHKVEIAYKNSVRNL